MRAGCLHYACVSVEKAGRLGVVDGRAGVLAPELSGAGVLKLVHVPLVA